MHFRCGASEARHLICQRYVFKGCCDIIHYVTVLHVHWSHDLLLYHQRPVGGWCLTHVGCDTSSISLGWSLLPSTVIIVLALVNSAVSPAGTSSISMRPGSDTLLPVSTTSTGLLHLSVGAPVHRVRSDTELSMWLLPCAHHIQCLTILGIPEWTPTEAV